MPLFESEGYAGADDETFAEGEGARWVLAWTEDGALARESFVNLIPTPAGGTHEAGLREGMFDAVQRLHRSTTTCCPRASRSCRRTSSRAPASC